MNSCHWCTHSPSMSDNLRPMRYRCCNGILRIAAYKMPYLSLRLNWKMSSASACKPSRAPPRTPCPVPIEIPVTPLYLVQIYILWQILSLLLTLQESLDGVSGIRGNVIVTVIVTKLYDNADCVYIKMNICVAREASENSPRSTLDANKNARNASTEQLRCQRCENGPLDISWDDSKSCELSSTYTSPTAGVTRRPARVVNNVDDTVSGLRLWAVCL